MSKETEKADEIDRGIHKEIREKRTGVRKFIADLLNMHDGMMSYEEIDEMMLENTVIHGPNMWILCLAALIASIGLNMNSTAVIIGAMLISPLMSGIMTMGYSLAAQGFRDCLNCRSGRASFQSDLVPQRLNAPCRSGGAHLERLAPHRPQLLRAAVVERNVAQSARGVLLREDVRYKRVGAAAVEKGLFAEVLRYVAQYPFKLADRVAFGGMHRLAERTASLCSLRTLVERLAAFSAYHADSPPV